MKPNQKGKIFLIVLIISVFFSVQCAVFGADKLKTWVPGEVDNSVSSKLLKLDIDEETTYVLPRPLVLFKLLSESKFSFPSKTEIKTETRYQTETKKALNLGSRCATGIAMMYGEPSESDKQKIGTTILSLAKSLDLIAGLEKEVTALQKSFGSATKKDTEILIDDIFASTEVLFNDRADQHLAVFVSLGGWIKALQISTKSLSMDYNAEASKVLSQGNVIDVYIKSLSGISELVKNRPALESINEALPTIKKLVTVKNNGPIPEENIKQLLIIATQLNEKIETR
ncbi:hypothetical protein KKA14_07530 [bacterium]|nr:hypothetical protein [bacterium]